MPKRKILQVGQTMNDENDVVFMSYLVLSSICFLVVRLSVRFKKKKKHQSLAFWLRHIFLVVQFSGFSIAHSLPVGGSDLPTILY